MTQVTKNTLKLESLEDIVDAMNTRRTPSMFTKLGNVLNLASSVMIGPAMIKTLAYSGIFTFIGGLVDSNFQAAAAGLFNNAIAIGLKASGSNSALKPNSDPRRIADSKYAGREYDADNEPFLSEATNDMFKRMNKVEEDSNPMRNKNLLSVEFSPLRSAPATVGFSNVVNGMNKVRIQERNLDPSLGPAVGIVSSAINKLEASESYFARAGVDLLRHFKVSPKHQRLAISQHYACQINGEWKNVSIDLTAGVGEASHSAPNERGTSRDLNASPGVQIGFSTVNERDLTIEPITLADLKTGYPNLISDADLDIETISTVITAGKFDRRAMEGKDYHEMAEILRTKYGDSLRYGPLEVVLDSKYATAKEKSLLLSPQQMMAAFDVMNEGSSLAKNFKYNVLTNNCRHASSSMFNGLFPSPSGTHVNSVAREVNDAVWSSELVYDLPVHLDAPLLIDLIKKSHLKNLDSAFVEGFVGRNLDQNESSA